MSVSSVSDLRSGYIKESLKWDEKERTAAAWWRRCVLCRARGDKNNEEKRKEKDQRQHVTAGAPTRKSVPSKPSPDALLTTAISWDFFLSHRPNY
jgi:hypothetical protein